MPKENHVWNRENYQRSAPVRDFAAWMGSFWDAHSLVHKYTIRQNRADWCCHSLSDAARNYCWPILRSGKPADVTSFETNSEKLEKWRSALDASLAAHDSERCQATCLALMRWGGTTSGNSKWITEQHKANRLVKYMQSARNTLSCSTLSLDLQVLHDLRSTAGLSKIYSLLVDRFVIYDSRVAAGLTWFVSEFCRIKERNSVPTELNFCVMPVKSRNLRRNPSDDRYRFGLPSSYIRHLRCNIMANWLFLEMVAQPRFVPLGTEQLRMRLLEAALFMVGYDLEGLGLATSCAL